MRIGICAGHSAVSPGASAGGVTEQGPCRRIVDAFTLIASGAGWRVVDPRSDERGLAYPEYLLHRIHAFADAVPDAAVDVHLNACGDPQVNHSLTIYREGNGGGASLARSVAHSFEDGLPWSSRGAVVDEDLGRSLAFLRRLPVPAIIVEAGFITNDEARAWLIRPEGQDTVARLLFDGIERWRAAKEREAQ